MTGFFGRIAPRWWIIGSDASHRWTQMKTNHSTPKTKVLFVDQKNDFVSQLAEHFAREMFPSLYETYSAGPEKDIVDCEMISVMYQNGEDIRRKPKP